MLVDIASSAGGQTPPEDQLAAVVASDEPQVALRDGRILVPRLVRGGERNPGPGRRQLRQEGTVLVTGGTGGLGALVAGRLVREHGVRHLQLLSRRGGETPGAATLAAELRTAGAETVSFTACDASDRAALTAALDRIPATRPLTGVVHAAGATDDALVTDLSPERLRSVMRVKATAAWHLHELTRDLDLAVFLLFSSIAGLVGGPGQGNYAAANAYLDALAEHRAAHGLAATSVAWGLWDVDTGITAQLSRRDRERIADSGFPPLAVEDGMDLLDAALASDQPMLVAAPLDLPAVRRNAPAPRLLAAVTGATGRRTAANSGSKTGALARRLSGLPPEEHRAALLATVRAEAAAVAGHPDPERVPAGSSFPTLGFDSLTSVELRNRLARSTGLALPPTVVFDHPTPSALAAFLHDRLTRAGGASSGANPAQSGYDSDADIDLAAEVVLPDDIRPAATGASPREGARHILLTGATGFLGAFLLRDLCRTTDATVHCLVRASDESEAFKRLQASLEWYQVWDDIVPSRLSVVVGDLARPRFGLDEDAFDHLARRTDVVVHNGAQVNWLQPYAALKAANVLGTVEVLRLAARHRTTPVHYVSTVGVFDGARADGAPLRPSDPTGPPEKLASGYLRSKWVAEGIVGLARQRGLPVSITRVDVVSGDRVNGACQTRDFVWLSLKGLIQARAVPQGTGGRFHLLPVDHVSAAITEIAANPGTHDGTYHLYNPNAYTLAHCVARLRARGYELEELRPEVWRERIAGDRDNALYPLLHAFELMTSDPEAFYPPIDTTSTDEVLAKRGITCPELTDDLFDRYIDFFVARGHLPPHPAAARG
ncbi:thioester reductase domain-containing protein [Streptomyces lonarensis]|uniref:thioester reductase domain-containing protein n=1 Tax=Streptomyces lonarensis TaxID=700599 RepID=UPI0028A68C5B|nr:thioester reductase domain-containing protein [Streptomyces lonarensis]